MADEKSVVKMNKMIHKKTGASFLVVNIIYVSLVFSDSKKIATFGRQLKCLLVCIQGGLYLFHYSGQSELASICFFLSNLIIDLMYNIKKLYFNDQQKFRV